MSKYYLYSCLTAALAFYALTIQAQKPAYQGKIKITPNSFAQRGDSLYVDLSIDVKGVNLNSSRSLSLIPLLELDNRVLALPEVQIKGYTNYKVYRREMALMSKGEHKRYQAQAPYQVVKESKRNNSQLIHYTHTLLFEPWMVNCRLVMQEDLCGCGASRQIAVERLVDNVSLEKVLEPYLVTPHLAYIQPATEVVKRRELENESFLDFAVSQTTIQPEFNRNPAELNKIRQMVEEIKSNNTITIRGVSITGYASPEGSLATNKRLSEGRAKALQSYLNARYDIPANLYTIVFGGEDWEGLAKLVKASDIAYKAEVLNIIEQVGVLDGRESQLMKFQKGAPYRLMLQTMFPSLRKVVIKVSYDVRDLNVAEASQLIKTAPQHLSLKEMYLVANQYQQGTQEFNDIFETAVRLFPKDETANLNAAASALARKDIVYAEKYLSLVTTHGGEYQNNMGVLQLLKGNYAEAETLLQAAHKAGIKEAQTNLEELEKKRANLVQLEKKTK